MWNSMKTAPKDGSLIWLIVRAIPPRRARPARYIARYDTWNGCFRNYPTGGMDFYNECCVCWTVIEVPSIPPDDLIRDFEKYNEVDSYASKS